MDDVVFSSSAIAAFKRCPKSFQLGYEMGLVPQNTIKQYVYEGAEVHEELSGMANNDVLPGKGRELMIEVAAAYLKHSPLPANIISAEKPMYTELMPGVYIRTTFDFVYEREDGTIVGRDYKTFEKRPSLDLDLDFQGRIYVGALMRAYPGHPVEFEYEYIRRVPPGSKNSKGVWKTEDCYLTFPLVISRAEADALWEETQWVAEKMLEARERNRYWRTDLKGKSPFTCGSCFYRNLCSAELEHGELTESDLAILAPTRKEPIVWSP
jgi:hypothetical protein